MKLFSKPLQVIVYVITGNMPINAVAYLFESSNMLTKKLKPALKREVFPVSAYLGAVLKELTLRHISSPLRYCTVKKKPSFDILERSYIY
jgi:hypothetical protein